MRGSTAFWGTALALLVIGTVAWMLGLGEVVRASVGGGTSAGVGDGSVSA